MFSKSGIELIEHAIGKFEAIKNDLRQGIEHVKELRSGYVEAISHMQGEIKKVEAFAAKAEKAINGIDKLLGGE